MDSPWCTEEDIENYLCGIVNPVTNDHGKPEWKLPYGFTIYKTQIGVDKTTMYEVDEYGFDDDLKITTYLNNIYDFSPNSWEYAKPDLDAYQKRPNFLRELDDIYRLTSKWNLHHNRVYFSVSHVWFPTKTSYYEYTGRVTYDIDGVYTFDLQSGGKYHNSVVETKNLKEFEEKVDEQLANRTPDSSDFE